MHKKFNFIYFWFKRVKIYALGEIINSATELLWQKDENLYSNNVECGILSENKTIIGENAKTLPLKYDYFLSDALVFLDLKSRKLTLENKNTAQKIKVDFDGFPYLLIWIMQDAKFICIEPWCGLPDFVGENPDFSAKRGIIRLKKCKETKRTHIIKFEN